MSQVYFLRCASTGLVKIGTSRNVASRLSQIQSDSPGKIALVGLEPGGVERERALHAHFAADRERGEWFRESSALSAYIATLPPIEAKAKRERAAFKGCPLSSVALCKLLGHDASYMSQMRNGYRPITLDVAVRLWKITGDKIGPLLPASDAEAEILHRYVTAAPFMAAAREPA